MVGQDAVALAKARIRTPHAASAYNLLSFLAYCFYPPLYLAGPLITCNAFIRCIQTPIRQSRTSLLCYAVRLAVALIALEVCLRIAPTFALAKSGVYQSLAPASMAIFGYAVLNAMWLKFKVSQ